MKKRTEPTTDVGQKLAAALRDAQARERARAREERRAAGTLKGATANRKKRAHGRPR